jgi:cleavage stimulation factor subunit 3
MSEPPTFDPEYPPDIEDADKTQPSDEILNVLENLAPTAPNTQERPPQTTAAETSSSVVPTSEWDTIRAQLHENRYDPHGWNKLVNLAEASGDIDKIKESYDALLEVYPNTV